MKLESQIELLESGKSIPMHQVEGILGDFLEAYVTCALWSSTDDSDNPMDDNYGWEDMAPACQLQFLTDCREFLDSHYDLIESNIVQAGHDFWLTRNRHGAGFWDGDWEEETGKILTDASHACGEVYLYVGDDGLIYC